MIASLADAEGANGAAGAPPASKHAVKSLVREQLTELRLQQLGGSGTECAVCRSAFSCNLRQHKGSACMQKQQVVTCLCKSAKAGFVMTYKQQQLATSTGHMVRLVFRPMVGLCWIVLPNDCQSFVICMLVSSSLVECVCL